MVNREPSAKRSAPLGISRRSWLFVFLAAVACLLVVAGLHLWRNRPSVQLERELAALRAQGRPVTIDDLRQPRIPDDENAAVLYAEAFKHLEGLTDAVLYAHALPSHVGGLTPEDHSILSRLGDSSQPMPSEEELQRAALLVAELEPALGLLEEGS